MADSEGKKLTELRVIDLKTELERRGLDKTGNKAALLERLSKAISAEGHNPEEFLIVPCVGASKTTPRKNSVTGVLSQDEAIEGSENQKEDNTDGQDSAEVKVKEEPPIVEDDTIPSRKKETQDEGIKKVVVKEEKQEVKEEVKDEPDENMGKKDTQKTNDVKPTECSAISPTTVTATATTVTAVEANGIDNEDSINLTIGEDEENLLVEESEVHDRQKVAQETPDQKCKPQEESVRVGERTGSSESDHIATLIVPADGGEKRKEENKKGDSKGSGRAEGAGNKEGAAGANGIKSKLDGGDGGKSGDSNSKGQKRDEKDKKISPVSPANASSRNLWVSGLSSTTRATDLKQIFSKYGKVIGAKVVTNARTPGARCYGYVTMSTSEDAAKCIQHLHRTELHGRVISVEKAKGDSQQSHMRKRESVSGKSEKREDKEKFKDSAELNDKKEKEVKKEVDEKEKEEKAIVKKSEETVEISDGKEKKTESTEKKEEPTKESDTRSTKSTSKKPEGDRGRRDEKRVRPWDHHRSHTRSRSRERRRRDDEERERQRLRERERILREEERRRQEDMKRQREIERRQREEAARLEREREKLRRERERIAQEKAELLRLERERQKLERENLEREQEELQRQQKRLEESRRPPPPPSIKRTSSDRRDLRDVYAEPERKRIASEHSRRHSPDRVSDRRPEILDRVSDRRLDQSPPSRYESSRSTQELGLKRDFKRGSDFPSRSTRPESFPEVSRGREVIVRREPLPAQTSSIDPRQVKDRYERPATTTYTRDRDIRRSEPESHRSSRDGHARYSESAKPPGSSASRDSRYGDSSRAPGGWHSGPPSSKSFNSVPSGGPRDPRSEPSGWSSRSSDNVNRWGSSGSMGSTMRHPGPPIYQGGPMPSMGLAPPGTGPSYDRFDPYKSSMPSMRKY